MSLMEKMFVLSGTLWLSTIAFIVYMWILHSKQQLVLRYIARKLANIETEIKKKNGKADTEKTKELAEGTIKKQETVVTISKNEPMSKYETANIPDEAEIKFVD